MWAGFRSLILLVEGYMSPTLLIASHRNSFG